MQRKTSSFKIVAETVGSSSGICELQVASSKSQRSGNTIELEPFAVGVFVLGSGSPAARNKKHHVYSKQSFLTCHYERSKPSCAPRDQCVVKLAWLVGQPTASLQQLLLAI
jgi:hypothetical protein